MEWIGGSVWEVLTIYIRGTVVVAFMDAAGIGMAMLLLGVPLVASLRLIVFIGAFVPLVGAAVSGALAVGVTLVMLWPGAAMVLLGAVLLVQQAEGNLIHPLVMGHFLHLRPSAMVVAVTVGTVIAGILGAIAAVPLVAVAYRVADLLVGHGQGPASLRQ